MGTRNRELFSSIGDAHANQYLHIAHVAHQRGEERRIPAYTRHPSIGMADRTPIAALEFVQDGLLVHGEEDYDSMR